VSCCRNLIGNQPANGNGNGGSAYPDPWEFLDGTEVFADDFKAFSGWTVYSGYDTTTTPGVDTNASVFRVKGANPCIDSTIRSQGLIVMPEHTANPRISIAQDISGSLDGDGDWCLVTKMDLPRPRVIANNSLVAGFGYSLPASNIVNYNATEIFAVETDASTLGLVSQQITNNSPGNLVAYDMVNYPSYPNTIWLFQYHKSGESVVTSFYSVDSGRTLCEMHNVPKNSSTFTTIYYSLYAVRQMTAYHQLGISYVRAYQSLKLR